MKAKRLTVTMLWLSVGFIASGCGIGQFLGPTVTPTATATLTMTATPTSTSTPTSTPTITPTPTPRLLAVALTLDDLPSGFKVMPAEQVRQMEKTLSEGGIAFGFSDYNHGQAVIGILTPLSTAVDQASFTNALPQLINLFAAAIGAEAKSKKLPGLDNIGQARAGMTMISKNGSLSLRWDIVDFVRGEVGVVLLIAYPDGDKPAVPAADLARLLDERVRKFLVSNP